MSVTLNKFILMSVTLNHVNDGDTTESMMLLILYDIDNLNMMIIIWSSYDYHIIIISLSYDHHMNLMMMIPESK